MLLHIYKHTQHYTNYNYIYIILIWEEGGNVSAPDLDDLHNICYLDHLFKKALSYTVRKHRQKMVPNLLVPNLYISIPKWYILKSF